MADDFDDIQNLSDGSGRKSPSDAGADLSKSGLSQKAKDKEKKLGHRRVDDGGETTYKKIQSRQIMGSIQLGIQHAIGGLASRPERDLLMHDFMTVETINFPANGSNHTPAHSFSEFKFKNYAPIAFRYFRDLFQVRPQDYLMSMCSKSLRELSNPGASGSIFYLTEDDEFILKTVQHKEGEFLQKLLPGYYMNLNQNPRTLLPKFFGLYCYQCNSKNIRLCAMNNLLPSAVKLHEKYDLKGSTFKRKASKSEREKKSPTFKDLDFMEFHPEGLFLEAETYNALVKTMQRDCRVLESFKIMDYSLLVGIHNLDQSAREKAGGEDLDSDDIDSVDDAPAPITGVALNRTKSTNRQRLVAHSTAMESIQADSEPIDQSDDIPTGGIPARNEKGERLLIFIGIIDILQSYRFKKKLEHSFKALVHDGDTVSVHRPGFYASRFMNFMANTVFKKIPSLDLPEIKGNHRKFRNLVTTYIALKNSPSKRKNLKAGRSIDAENGDKADASSLTESQNGGVTSPIASLPAPAPKTVDSSPSTSLPKSSAVKKASPPRISPASPLASLSPPSYPAVLGRGGPQPQKNKVPPPVPPRGSHRAKSDPANIKGFAPSSTPPPAFDDVVRGDTPLRLRTPLSSRNLRDDNSSGSDHRLEHKSSLSVESSCSGGARGLAWTPPASIEGSTPTWTEGTPSFTESSSSGDIGNLTGCHTTPLRGYHVRRDSSGPKSLTDGSDQSLEMTHL